MSAEAKYEVSVSGVLLEGFEAPPVVEAFSELFSVSPEKAASFVGSKRVVKKDLTFQEATVYHKKLVSIGIDVIMKDMATGKVIDAANDPTNSASVESFGLVPNDEIPGVQNSLPKDKSLSCPKCELHQEKSDQCIGCGVFFSKIEDQARTDLGSSATTTVATAKKSTAGKPETEESDFTIGQFLFPVIAAISGAVIWKMIAMTMGYEFGFVAWGIGGAVGMAAVWSGASGDRSGITCAILVVLAIFGGKYMTYSALESQWIDTMADVSSDIDLQPIYDEMKYDAAKLADTPYDNASLRTYMYDHSFTDASSASNVTNQELEDFKLYSQPELEEFYRDQPSYANWKSNYIENVNSLAEHSSTTSLVFDSLGVLDLMFLLLGITTAYQIGRAGKS